MNEVLTEESFWSDAWPRHLEAYLQAPPRCGYWLANRFSKQNSVLEIGGGSCRDSRFLSTVWKRSVGSDFDEETIAYLQAKFPDSKHKMLREDAFSFSFAPQSFDLTFSNGFWVLFRDDEAILRLACEQARVTGRWMIIIVHNGLNPLLRANFALKSQDDPLYDIRFFTPDEVEHLVRASGIPIRSLSIEKFGGRSDALYHSSIKGIPNPFWRRAPEFVPRLYALQSWRHSERIACVVELEI